VAYVDDIIVMCRQSTSLIVDQEDTFNNLRCFNIKLNPEKCPIGVPRGKLLGYIITERSIEANPNKTSSITKLGQVRNIKDVQRFMGCLVALSRFVSRLGECGLPCTSY
jgi:hypothetical protein